MTYEFIIRNNTRYKILNSYALGGAMKFSVKMLVLVAVLTIFPMTAHSHEFILKPVQPTADKNSAVEFNIISAHKFMVSEEMEPIDQVEVVALLNGETTSVEIAPNEKALSLDGSFKAKENGTLVLAGHRKGMIWTQTTKGWKQASKKGLEGVIKSGKYEKFAKALVTVGQDDESYGKPVGQGLEIIPLSNPMEAKVGDEVEFKFLYKGKSFTPKLVFATYDGFSDLNSTYAYATEPYGKGVAKVKITHPGTWMVRVQHESTEPSDDYDQHVMRSVLVFEVD